MAMSAGMSSSSPSSRSVHAARKRAFSAAPCWLLPSWDAPPFRVEDGPEDEDDEDELSPTVRAPT